MADAIFGMPIRTAVIWTILLIAMVFFMFFMLQQSGIADKFAGIITGTMKSI